MTLADAGALPYKMQMHGTALIGDRMYVFGGDLAGGSQNTLWTSRVQSAPIDTAQAKIGEWREEEPLPDMRSYLTNCVEVVNDRIYIVGGNIAQDPKVETSTASSKTIAWTKVKSDGSLERWRVTPPYPGSPPLLTAVCATDDHLLITGGYFREGMDKIYRASFTAEGEPVDWTEIGKLPHQLYNHGACMQNDRIYVWGGLLAASQPNSSVWSAPFTNGQIGQWRREEPMPDPTYGASCCGINDYLVSIGGRYKGSQPTNDIWFARLGEAGRVSKWQPVRTNMEATVYHTLGLLDSNGWVFITGGQNKQRPTNDDGFIIDRVQAFKIPATSDGSGIAVGLPGIDQALRSAKADGKKVLVYFYSPAVPSCKRLWDEIISKPEFAAQANGSVLAAVDTSQKDSTWSYKLGVFRVPALVELSADGKVLRQSGSLSNADDVRAFAAGQ